MDQNAAAVDQRRTRTVDKRHFVQKQLEVGPLRSRIQEPQQQFGPPAVGQAGHCIVHRG